MRRLAIVNIICAYFLAPNMANSFTITTHERVTKDALKFMGSIYATKEQKRAYNVYVSSAKGLDNALNLLGKAAGDVDKFKDTRMGGWWVGYHYSASDLSLGLVENNYTSWWHFLTMTRGSDSHGNDHGGYNYKYRTDDTSFIDYDWIVMAWLYNQELKEDDYKRTESNYRQGSYSSWKGQYRDFQSIPWQPVDNLGKFWYEKFKQSPSFQYIGYVTHAGADVAVAQHTWNTIANNHPEYESWVEDFYYKEKLNDLSLVAQYTPTLNAKHSVRSILTQTAEQAYLRPTVLFSKRHSARLNVAKVMVPMAIATNVTILTKAINYLYGEGGQ